MLRAPVLRRAAWLLLTGISAAPLLAAPDGTAMPHATASRACAYQHARANRAPVRDVRSAVVCLINLARRHWRLPPLYQQPQLTRAAQTHSDEMVADGFFSHASVGGAEPWTRIARDGFRWSAVGEAISTGVSTPAKAVSGWLSSTEHCRILLSPAYRDVGIGVNRRPVRGVASGPATWTADFALHLGSTPPSANAGPADGCPY